MKKPCLQSSQKLHQGGTTQISGGILLERAGSAVDEVHFWSPNRWHYLIKLTQRTSTLQIQIGQEDVMGDDSP